MARALAEITMVVHFAALAYIVLGAFLAWHWPKTILIHLPFALWGLAIVTLNFECPLTPVEDYFRAQAGQADSAEGFIARYIDGVLYPEQYLTEARLVAAGVVVVGYAGAIVAWRRASRRRWSDQETGALPG